MAKTLLTLRQIVPLPMIPFTTGILNSFKLLQMAKKLSFCTYFSSFFPSLAQLCNSKKPSTRYKTPNFRLIPKSLNGFTVKSGESLSKIAKHYYGDAMKYNKVFEANTDQLKNPDVIHPDQVLVIPNL